MSHADTVLSAIESATAAARCRIAASWHRSHKRHGLDPSSAKDARVLVGQELSERREQSERLIRIASAKLDQLHGLVGASGCAVVLTDSSGVILDQRFSAGDAGSFRSWGLVEGADWSEESEGTNGIGTCLVEGKSVIVHRGEHFFSKNVAMSCIDSPIYGADGGLIGALDVSSARADQTGANNKLLSAMVAQTARQIEADNFRAAFTDARIVFAGDAEADRNALVAINADDVIIGATRAARQHYGWSLKPEFDPVAATDLFGRGDGVTGFERGEKAAVVKALTRAGGNATAAARDLGIARATLYRRMKRLGLTRKD
ncbi:MAG: GAF domain-containing protein [Pseudomonadota bacterium]